MPDIHETLTERGNTHGEFTDNAKLSQRLKVMMRRQEGWDNLTLVQREALEVTAAKIARILCGDPHEPDHWRDLAGYATLVLDRLEVKI
jgi:hypothetical protein